MWITNVGGEVAINLDRIDNIIVADEVKIKKMFFTECEHGFYIVFEKKSGKLFYFISKCYDTIEEANVVFEKIMTKIKVEKINI
jgi:hypothetical protein